MLGAVVLLAVAVLTSVNRWMVRTAQPLLYQDIATVPGNEVAVVLAADLRRPDGTTNTCFLARTRNAAALFKAGKVQRLLVTGHPDNRGYNEPRGMAAELVRLGVPPGRIDLDENGDRTWHSFVSVQTYWQLANCTIVTDEFHAPRAIYLARKAGVDAVAFSPPPTTSDRWTLRSEVREWFSRVRALADGLFAE